MWLFHSSVRYRFYKNYNHIWDITGNLGLLFFQFSDWQRCTWRLNWAMIWFKDSQQEQQEQRLIHEPSTDKEHMNSYTNINFNVKQ